MRVVLTLCLLAACRSAPPYAVATTHTQLGERSYLVDVELGDSRDFETANRYANRRAAELCESGYDIVQPESFSYRTTRSSPSERMCWSRGPTARYQTCAGGGNDYGNSSHAYVARIECRWHGL